VGAADSEVDSGAAEGVGVDAEGMGAASSETQIVAKKGTRTEVDVDVDVGVDVGAGAGATGSAKDKGAAGGPDAEAGSAGGPMGPTEDKGCVGRPVGGTTNGFGLGLWFAERLGAGPGRAADGIDRASGPPLGATRFSRPRLQPRLRQAGTLASGRVAEAHSGAEGMEGSNQSLGPALGRPGPPCLSGAHSLPGPFCVLGRHGVFMLF
jgi:hypothetical protein